MKDQKNYTPYYKPIDFIPIIGIFTETDRNASSRAEAFMSDVNSGNFHYDNKGVPFGNREYDYPGPGGIDVIMYVYHAAWVLGAVFSPLIYRGLENLFK